MCISMLIAALFEIVKIWEQPKFPSIDEWIKNVANVHNRFLVIHEKR